MKSLRTARAAGATELRPATQSLIPLCFIPLRRHISLAPPRASTPVAGPSRRSHSSHAGPPPALEPIPPITAKDSYDVVIIGGANAGLALACALLDQPTLRSTTQILLIEGGSLDKVRAWTGKGPWENRVSSLTAENVAWLDRIGAWKHIVEDRSCPVDEMVVWANPTKDSTPAIHFPPLDHPMARMTENTNLQRALLRRIEEVGGNVVIVRENARVGEMRLDEGGRWVGLRIGENEWVRGSVVVGADGPNSPVRRFSGIDSPGHGYETHGVVATLHHEANPVYPNHTAFQRFLPTGPIAFLPLSPTASTMVWSTRPTHAAAYKRLSPEAFTLMVNAGYTMHEDPLAILVDRVVEADKAGLPLSETTIAEMIAELNITGEAFVTAEQAILPPSVKSIEGKSVASFPLRLSHAEEYLGERTVLVGDAAHTTHPLAGQGLNMGLADVRVLAETWEEAKKTGGDLGAKVASLEYPRKRWAENALMLTAVDTFHHVFRSRNPIFNLGRGVAFDVINELGPLKKMFMGGAGAGGSQGKVTGWGSTGANALEGWIGFKSVVGMAAGFAGELAKNGLRRAADGLEKRRL